ncbi:ABC transporter substrate-binding protein [Nakamurella lactea]|uniref:ABC transporter substrate-binding protein n=1 Tax=Nakamurella lactea TaxID=459515 RepID=UPI00048ADA7E|nr:ABC transporter substrate-binding protein [Nakamurella lactea]
MITIGQTIGVSQLDPNISTLSSERVMWNLLYDGLTKQTESGEVEPDLATEWSASDDGLTWTFTLRDGVKFHDGRALVADDVVQVVQRVLDEKNASPQRSKLAAVTAVAATDEKTVTFTMSGPMPQMPAALVDVKIIDAKNLDKLNTTGNGTGPYKLDSFVPDQELSVVPNPDYWAGQPGNGGIKIVKYADETAGRTALGSGAVDILWAVPYDQVSGLQDSGLNIVSPSNPSQTSIFEVDGAHGTFADAQARQALSYAVDRKTMQEAAFGGLGEINYGSTLVSPSNKYYDKAAVQDYSYDLDKAKELFAEAGVKQGTKFTCWASSSSPQYRTQCEILQQSLAEIGYTVAIQVNEGSTWAAKFYPAGKDYSDLIVPNFLSREPAPLPFVASYFGKDGWSESNWAGTPEYEMTKSSIKTATEESDIKSAFADFQKITSTEQPVISVLNVGEPSATGTDIEGVWIESDGTIHVEGATGK